MGINTKRATKVGFMHVVHTSKERKKGVYSVEKRIQRKIVKIGGMTCVNCENKIENKLRKTKGIQEVYVSYNKGTAHIVFDCEQITEKEIFEMIEQLGYSVNQQNKVKTAASSKYRIINQVLGTVILLLAISILMKQFGISRIFDAFPKAEENMGYGMLFLIGVLTSVHCIGMCGGIHLSQCLSYQRNRSNEKGKDNNFSKWEVLYPSFLYNAGRVLSYTVIGGIVGALGSVVSFSGAGKGIVQLVAGVFMVIMGLNMLNIFPWLRKFNPRMPKIFARKLNQRKQNRGPFYIGILNGLMPCGPLQAMQLYALSTGSPIKGAFSMFLFSIGTVPLLFGFGALSSLLSQKFTNKVMKVGAAFVVILGISMFQNGWSLSGFPMLTTAVAKEQEGRNAQVEDGVQVIHTTLSRYGYEPITVQVGVPVRWTITAENGSLTGCNSAIIIPEYEIQKSLEIGENVIEFTPTKAGTYSYSCWMGMLRSSITVLEEGQDPSDVTEESANSSQDDDLLQGNVVREPANYQIPTDKIEIANIEGDVQSVEITLGKNRFQPAVIVLEKGLETEWTINIEKMIEGHDMLVVPDYNTIIPLEEGANTISLYPYNDFEFLTEDNKIFGYVKVVDDINNVDLDAIKKEVVEYVTYTWD